MVLEFLVLVLVSSVAIADDSQPAAPNSPASVEAKQKHDAAIKQAKEAYHKAVISAEQQYIADLDAALRQAMSNQDIDSVRALDDQERTAKEVLRELESEAISGVSTPRDFTWERIDCPAPVASPQLVPYRGKLYLVGGVDSDNNTCTDAIWTYDLDAEKWERKNATMPYGVYAGEGSGPIVVGSRMLWSPGFGPTINGGWGQHNRILTYDFAADNAMETAEYPGQARVWAVALGTATIDGATRVYCFGGWNGGGINSICRFDAGTDRFEPAGNSTLSTGRVVWACAADRAGRFVLFGHTARVDLFDGRTETLESLGDILPKELLTIRTNCSFAWCDNDGRFFVARVGGGRAKAYQFDLTTRQFSPATFNFPTPQLNFDNCKGTYDVATGRMYLIESRWDGARCTSYLWIGSPAE
jgi:hypothetical protein